MHEHTSTQHTVSVCVAVYKRHDAPNLATLAASLDAAAVDTTIELVVALNGISAADAGVPSWARVVDLGINRGVAPGWNAAAGAATGDVLAFVNDDALPGPGSLDQLTRVLLARDDAGVVGPAGSRWDFVTGHAGPHIATDHHPVGTAVECESIDGYLFLCRRSTFDGVGGFDEFYAPATWEEVDFCTAVRATGQRVFAVAGVDVQHEYAVSRRQMPWRRVHFDGRSETLRSIHRRNRLHFLDKWRGHPLTPIQP